MLGYLFITIVVLLLFIFTYQHVRRFFSESKKQQTTGLSGYYLVSHTYEETNHPSHYYGVFQQGEHSYTLELTLQLYLQIKPPMRGKLVAQDGKVQSFES